MFFYSVDHQKKTRKLEQEFSQFNKKDKEAMALLCIVALSPELEDKARKSLDDDGYFQIRLFKNQTQDLEGANQVLALLAIAIFSKDSFHLDTLEALNDEQFNVALEAIRYCYKNKGGIYEVDNRPMILKEVDTATPTPTYLGQTQIAEMIKEQGIDMDRRKVSVYYKRGHLPEPDVMLGKIPGWKKESIEKWIIDYKAGRIVQRRKRD